MSRRKKSWKRRECGIEGRKRKDGGRTEEMKEKRNEEGEEEERNIGRI